MHLDVYEPIWLKFGLMIETAKLYILISVWMTLTSFLQVRKAKNAAQIIYQSFQSI